LNKTIDPRNNPEALLTLLGRYMSSPTGTDEERVLAIFLHAMECGEHWASTGCKGRHIRDAMTWVSNMRILESYSDEVRD
jgi:hypothetical protein